MNINSFKISDALQLIPISIEEAMEYSKDNQKQIWSDLKSFENGELEHWFDTFEVKELTKRLVKKVNHRVGFYPFNSELLIIIPVILESGGEGNLAILCRENSLLTIHKEKITCLERRNAEEDLSNTQLYVASTSALLSAILMNLSLEIFDKVSDLKNAITLMEDKFEKDPGSLEITDIMQARTQQLLLESIVFGQSPSIEGLKVFEKPFFKLNDAKDYLNCSEVNLQSAKHILDRLENRILDLRSQFQMNNQEDGNRRLNMLSIVSAVFLPTTFLAGFWGMNFPNMPMLDTSYGFVIACLLMSVIPIWMLVYFYRKGWFN